MPNAISRRRALESLAGTAALSLAGPAQAAVTARQYHPLAASSHLQTYLTKIWDAVRSETQGRLDVTVYPRNGDISFAEPQLLQLVQSGELEFFVLNGNILSQAHPIADIQGIPFAFKSSDEIGVLNDGALGELMRDELAHAGLYLMPFGAMENGFKHITAVAKPIGSAADLENFRMRTAGGALFVDFYEALGAKPVVIGLNRLYRALSDGEADGQDNPLALIQDQKLYEPCRYLSLSGHQWAGFNMIANSTFWKGLPGEWRDIVIRNTRRFVAEQRAFVQALNRQLEEKLAGKGMIVNTVDIASFRRKLAANGFYHRWRRSVGEAAWRLMERETGPVP